MSNRGTIPTKNHVCIHLKVKNACDVAGCEHFDMRSQTDRVAQLFGPNPNSAAAAALYRQDAVEYERLRKEAVARHLIAPRLSDRAAALKIDVDEFK